MSVSEPPRLRDVDYGGSIGYGREYRNRLHQDLGIVDVEDSTNAAKFIVENKKADPARVAITGGSAGGYTTLCALIVGTLFKVGASYVTMWLASWHLCPQNARFSRY